jgi:hypothetical protein
MDDIPKMSREQYIARMRGQLEEVLGQVADAINEAPGSGHAIRAHLVKQSGPTWVTST